MECRSSVEITFYLLRDCQEVEEVWFYVVKDWMVNNIK